MPREKTSVSREDYLKTIWEIVQDEQEPISARLAEELGVRIEARDLEPYAFASHAYEDFHLLMPLYLCRNWQGEPEAREVEEIRWVPPMELRGIAMPPADAPLVDILIERLAR